MAELPKPGDSHGNLLRKIVVNTFEGGGGGGAIGDVVVGSTPDRVLQTGPLGQLESGVVTTTELGFLAGATSNIQVQIDALSGGGIVGIESLADATAMWITADENIGIGTSAPVSLLEIKARAPLAGTGTVSSSGVTLTGVGTAFLTQLHVGDTITANGQTVTVVSIASNTSLVAFAAFSPSLGAGTAFTYQLTAQRWTDSGGLTVGALDSRGRMFLGSKINATAIFNVESTGVDPFESVVGVFADVDMGATTAASSRTITGFFASLFISPTSTQNFTSSSAVRGFSAQIGMDTGSAGVVTAMAAIVGQVTNFGSGTITSAYVFRETAPSAGGYTNFAGIALVDHTVATNNTNLLIGTTTIPAGNFSIYNSSAHVNYFEGSFGIGTSAPEGKLHVFSASAGVVTPHVIGDEFVIEGTGSVGMSILTSTTGFSFIVFGSPTDNDTADIGFAASTGELFLETQGVGGLSLFTYAGDIRLDSFDDINFSGDVAFFDVTSVGIGTSAPDGTLHVFSGSAGVVTAATAASQLVVEHSTHAGISILTPNNVNGHIVFGDPDDNVIGQIIYTHSVDAFTFVAGGVSAFQVSATQVSPGVDNAISLGAAGARWTEVFAVASLINTSDAREKHAIDNISGEFARYLVDKITPRSYAWNSEAQRGTHYGFVAQEIEAVINSRGLVANEFAPLHYDHENDRYGLREAELLPFLWRVVQDLSKRVAAIET